MAEQGNPRTTERKREKNRSRTPGRWRRRLGWAAMAVVLLLLLLYVGVPMAVRYGGAAYASSQIRGEVTLGMVTFDPWSLTIQIDDTRVTDLTRTDVARVERIVLDADLRTAWGEPLLVAEELRLVRPWLNVARDASGTINLLELALPTEDDPAGEEAGIPLVEIRRLSIEEAVVAVKDESMEEAVAFAIEPADVTFENLQTRGGVPNVHRVGAKLLGGDVTWDGTFDLTDRAIQGTISATHLDLGRFHPYVLHYGGYAVAPGAVAELQATVDVNFAGGKPQGTASVARLVWTDVAIDAPHALVDRAQIARLAVEDVQADVGVLQATVGRVTIAEIAAEPFGTIGQVRVTEIAASAETLAATVGQVTVEAVAADAYGAVEQVQASDIAADGKTLAATVADATIHGITSPYGKAATVEADGIEVDGARPAATIARALVRDADSRYGSAAELEATELSADGSALTLRLGAGRASQIAVGPLATVQQASLTDLAADAAAQTASIATIEVGGVTAALDKLLPGEAEQLPDALEDVEPDPAAARPAWDVQLATIDVHDVQSTYGGNPLAAWQRLLVEQVRADTGDLSATVERVALEQPMGYLRITESGEVELEPLTRSEQVMAIIHQLRDARGSVGVVRLTDGRIELLDRSAPEKPLQLDAHSIAFEARDILQSSDTPTTYTLDLRVGETGSLRSEGQANPLARPAAVRFTVSGSDLPLTVLTGYARRFLGYPIDRGAASIELSYEMVYPDIAGSNDIVLDQFYLGEKDPTAEGLGVPVKFGLSVLRDRGGQIKLRVPIEGDLDNPSFDFQQIVTRAILNVVAKAVTSPFSLLAGIVGSDDGDEEEAPDAVADMTIDAGEAAGGDRPDVEVRLAPGPQPVDADALSAVQFPVGSAELTAAERRELRMLARALYERPALKLTIMGEASTPGDAVALLREQAKQAVGQVLAEGRGQPIESVGGTEVDARYEQAVRELYAQLDAGGSIAGDEVLARLADAARDEEQARSDAEEAADIEPDAAEEAIAYAEEIDVPLELAERAVLRLAPAPAEALAALAEARAQATRDRLLAVQPDLADRIAIMAVKINGQPRANLSLALEE